MQVFLNGSIHSVAEGSSIMDLVEAWEFADAKGVAVAVDGTVIRRAEWNDARLLPDQRVEIVRAVQGG